MEIITILFLLTPIIFLGEKYNESIKEVIKTAYDKNLYYSENDNLKFLTNCRSLIYRLKRNNERKFSIYGGFLLIMLIYFFDKYQNVEYCDLKIKLLFIITYILIFILLSILLNISWNNFYLIHFINRFENKNFNFKIYNLDKNLGINEIKKLFRYTLLLNVLFLISFYSLIPELFKNNHLILFVLAFFFIGGNISSLYFLLRLYLFLKIQFNEIIKKEKEHLEKLEFNKKYQKFEFLKDLKLNILYNWSFKIKDLFFLIPLITKILIEKYGESILDLLRKMFDLDV
jgi:hypothetical protein